MELKDPLPDYVLQEARTIGAKSPLLFHDIANVSALNLKPLGGFAEVDCTRWFVFRCTSTRVKGKSELSYISGRSMQRRATTHERSEPVRSSGKIAIKMVGQDKRNLFASRMRP